MRIAQPKPLFAWDCLEDSPTWQTLRELLAAIPDGKLLESLRSAHGKGRNDDPVSVLWGIVVLTIALRHWHTEACLGTRRIAIGENDLPPDALQHHRIRRGRADESTADNSNFHSLPRSIRLSSGERGRVAFPFPTRAASS